MQSTKKATYPAGCDAGCLAAFERLGELSRLGEDWDGYGGHPPSAVSVATASQMIVAVAQRLGDLLGTGATPHTVMPVADGGIIVEWRADRISVHLDVAGDGNLGHLIDDRRGPERRFEEADNLALDAAPSLVERALLT